MQPPPPWATAANTASPATIHNRATSTTMQPRAGHSSGQGGGVDYQRQQEQQNDDQLAQLRSKVSALRNVALFVLGCAIRTPNHSLFPFRRCPSRLATRSKTRTGFWAAWCGALLDFWHQAEISIAIIHACTLIIFAEPGV